MFQPQRHRGHGGRMEKCGGGKFAGRCGGAADEAGIWSHRGGGRSRRKRGENVRDYFNHRDTEVTEEGWRRAGGNSVGDAEAMRTGGDLVSPRRREVAEEARKKREGLFQPQRHRGHGGRMEKCGGEFAGRCGGVGRACDVVHLTCSRGLRYSEFVTVEVRRPTVARAVFRLASEARAKGAGSYSAEIGAGGQFRPVGDSG